MTPLDLLNERYKAGFEAFLLRRRVKNFDQQKPL
jgi:hypothetical protein